MTTKKIIFPVLAAMIAVGAAFATSEKKEEKGKAVVATFYVVSEEGSNYVVTTAADPNCGAGSQVCQISTTETPNNNRVSIANSTATGWKN